MSNDVLSYPFFEETPVRRQVAQLLSGHLGKEAKVNRLYEHSGVSWGLYVKPPRNCALADALDSDQELLLWVCESADFQVRTLNEAFRAIDTSENRLRKDVFLLVTADPSTGSKVRAAQVGRKAMQAIAISLDQFLQMDGRSLVSAVQGALFERDLFDVRTPLHGPDSFFGHSQLINSLVEVAQTGSAACLFGLRKTGKTSLLYQVRERLSERKDRDHMMVAFYDMEASSLTAMSSQFGDEFFRTTAGNLYDSAPWLRKNQQLVRRLRLVGPDSATQAIEKHTAATLLASDIKAILKVYEDLRVLIMLDEVELAYESTVVENTLPVLRFLRSLVQDPSLSCVSLIVAGTNPRRVFSNSVTVEGGREIFTKDNPFYDFFSQNFLSPMPDGASRELLLRLGRRMGLVFSIDAAAELHSLTGGHPALLRQLASRIHHATKGSRPVDVSASTVTMFVDEFRRVSEETCSQMLAVLRRDYQDSFVILESLATGRVEQFRSYVDQFGSEAQLCIDYGLFDGPSSVRLNSALLQTYMQRRNASRADGAATLRGKFSPGNVVARYEIIELIGEPGGFGEVYRAKDTESGDVYALKILHRADVRALNREVQVLERIQEESGGHPGIVKLISWAREESRDVPYLVMEYLDGRPLAYHCSAATRLASDIDVAGCLLSNVLEALDVLHPNTERVEEIREASSVRSLTEAEYEDLERAKRGHVHRDIKPQNIIVVPGRGAVLIDFGITSMAQSPVTTLSHSRGYMPPGWDRSCWSPRVDMYQVGITFAQAIEGVRIEPDATDVLGPLEGFFRNVGQYGSVGVVVNGLIKQEENCLQPSSCLKVLKDAGQRGVRDRRV